MIQKLSRLILGMALCSVVTCQWQPKTDSADWIAVRRLATASMSAADLTRTARTCVREICPHSDKTLTLGDARKVGDVSALYDGSYIKPLIDEHLNRIFQGRQDLGKLARRIENTTTTTTTTTTNVSSSNVRRQLEMIFATSDFLRATIDFIEERSKVGENPFPISRERVQASFISPKSKGILIAADDRRFLTETNNVLNRLINTNVQQFLMSLDPKPKTLEEGLQKLRNVCRYGAQKLEKRLGLPTWWLARSFDDCLLDTEILAKNEAAQSQAFGAMMFSILIADFLEKGTIPALSEVDLQSRLSTVIDFMKGRLPSSSWNDEAERAYCHKKIARNWLLSVFASRVQAAQAIEMTKTVIDAAVTEFGENDPRAAKLRAYLESIPVTLPTELQAVKDIVSQLNGNTAAFAALAESSNFDANLIGVVMMEDLARALHPDRIQLSAKEICDEINVPLINDQFLGAWKQIDMGQIAALRLEYGFGIFAHEIGHAVAHFMRESTAQPTVSSWEHRRCVDTFHGGTEGVEGLYTEEDWADYFSGRLLKRLKPSHPNLQNFACLFSKTSQRHGVWAPPLSNTTSDVHSNNFFRMVHVHKVMNEQLPTSCSTVLNQIGEPSCI